MKNLRFGGRAQPLNPIVCKKADRVYRYRTTFSPSAINRCFMEDPSWDNDILCGLNTRCRYFSRGSSEIQKDFLAPDFYLNCFLSLFLSFIQRRNFVINPVNSNTTVQSPYVPVEELCLSKTLYLTGKAGQLAMLTFNYSPITFLVALKSGPRRNWWYLWH